MRAPPCRLCCGSRLGGWLYFWLLSGACAAAYVLVGHYLLHEHFGWVDINSGVRGTGSHLCSAA